MDPSVCLTEALKSAQEILALIDSDPVIEDHEVVQAILDEAELLAARVLNLHEWIVKGGFLPAQWNKTNGQSQS